jgi:hypothetical protein
MKAYHSLYKLHSGQAPETAFAHFYPVNGSYDEPFRLVAAQTMDGEDAWAFQQERFKTKYRGTNVPKLKNYLNYTFRRLLDLEQTAPGKHFIQSKDDMWTSFNTGLQNHHGSDLIAIFQKYKQREGYEVRPVPDWVFKGCYTPNDRQFRDRFGTTPPELATFSSDSRDFVFDTSYTLERDVFDHLFDRAKERAGLPNASDEIVHNYLRGALENLIPKIRRNYKIAIPVWYVEERRMQLLLPFISASNRDDVSCFLVDRDDTTRYYRLKTVYDLDQAYFAARLITRPDRDWLNP